MSVIFPEDSIDLNTPPNQRVLLETGGAYKLDSVLLLKCKDSTQNNQATLLLHHLFLPRFHHHGLVPGWFLSDFVFFALGRQTDIQIKLYHSRPCYSEDLKDNESINPPSTGRPKRGQFGYTALKCLFPASP